MRRLHFKHDASYRFTYLECSRMCQINVSGNTVYTCEP
uniref:Uncharacterized protein n=1 Tax=Anguilla anguilla TaxID=7936 RepID=A0A0E9R5A2_ANGAN